MQKMRYIDFGDNLVLIEKPIVPSPNGKVRYVNIQEYGEDEYIFDKIYTIFIFNQNNWLYFDTQKQKKTLPIFNPLIDKIYLFAKVPSKFPIETLGENICVSYLLQNGVDPLFEAAYAAVQALFDQKESSIYERILCDLKDNVLQQKLETVTSNEKHSNVLDILYDLMNDPDICFYPFHGIKKEYGFVPDSSFAISFSKLDWKQDELTLSVTLSVPGIYHFPNHEFANHDLPEYFPTYSTITVNVIKKGNLCFDKLMIGNSTNKGYIKLSDYSLSTSPAFELDTERICKVVHQRNTLRIYYLLLSYLYEYYCTTPEDFISSHKKMFEYFSDSQKEFLTQHRIVEDCGYISTPSFSTEAITCNIFEDELDTFLKYFEISLKTKLKDMHNFFPLIFDSFLSEMTSIIFEKIDNDIGELKPLLLKARRELSAYDYEVQATRFHLAYKPQQLLKNDEIKLQYDSFNFLLQINRLGCL